MEFLLRWKLTRELFVDMVAEDDEVRVIALLLTSLNICKFQKLANVSNFRLYQFQKSLLCILDLDE